MCVSACVCGGRGGGGGCVKRPEDEYKVVQQEMGSRVKITQPKKGVIEVGL